MNKIGEACPQCKRGRLKEALTYTRDEAEEPILVLFCEECEYERLLRRLTEEEVEELFQGEGEITIILESAIHSELIASP